MGPGRINVPGKSEKAAFDDSITFFVRFEDVAFAIRILWENADEGIKTYLYNDG